MSPAGWEIILLQYSKGSFSLYSFPFDHGKPPSVSFFCCFRDIFRFSGKNFQGEPLHARAFALQQHYLLGCRKSSPMTTD